jgi:hypothetical protein
MLERQGMVQLALDLAGVVDRFVGHARSFFNAVVLSGVSCPQCDGHLAMERDGRCRCTACAHSIDPTITFQRCPTCGAKPKLHIRRYACSSCGAEITSRFLFDGLAFDATYFRQKMSESRERQRERRERVRQMLAETRSASLLPPAADLAEASDLLAALNQLTGECEPAFPALPRSGFNLKRYESHVQAHIQPVAVDWEQIPPLSKDARIDRVWRFIAIIFLAHAGIADVWQVGHIIMVRQRETDRERQEFPGDTADTDGIERPLGRVAT